MDSRAIHVEPYSPAGGKAAECRRLSASLLQLLAGTGKVVGGAGNRSQLSCVCWQQLRQIHRRSCSSGSTPSSHLHSPITNGYRNDNKTDCVAYRGGREAGEWGIPIPTTSVFIKLPYGIWMQSKVCLLECPLTLANLRNYHPLIATFQTIQGPFQRDIGNWQMSLDRRQKLQRDLYFLIQSWKQMT